MNKKDLLSYVRNESNGLKKTVETKGGIKVEVFALRRELLSIKDDQRISIKDSLVYFMVSFSAEGKEALSQVGNFDQYAQLINSLSFNPGQYCKLISDRDTLDLVNSYFLNTYGTSSSNNLLVVFKKKDQHADYELVLSDLGFGTSRLKFLFRRKDIEKLQHINVTK